MPAVMQGATSGEWVEPKQFFQGKIVFLDSIAEPLQDTPIGLMPQNEVLAHATATLLTEATVRSPAPFWSFLWPAALGLWVGHLCGRRRPIEGTWRVAGVVFLIALVTTAAFLLSATWIDPVVPTLAALGAFVLATQFTFELERGERERNRALLQRFVAPQLVDEMLDDPDFELGLGGRRRQVCVVFADVRNFTGFAEANTPEHVIEVTNRYLSAMTDAMHHYGGILDKYTGDGLMAFFEEGGAGQEREPLPLMARAVQACIAMQQSTAAVSAELHRQGLPPLNVGIGLHYGEAVVGFVGNPNRLDYTALGHTVVVSQRLQSIAAGGEVIISETVFRAVSGMFPVVPGEPVQVKGLSEPMTPYRVGTLPPDHGAYAGLRQDL